MADSSSRSLLQSHGDSLDKRYLGHRSLYKTPTYILATLTLLVACVVLTVAILIKAHKDPVKSWNVQPTVLLSLVSGSYAVLLGALFAFGVAITWWRSIANGTTLNRLHHIHAGSNPIDLIPSLRAGNDARRVAMVALIVFIAKIGVGPLTQRAIKPRNQEVTNRIDMNIHLAEEIQDGYFGTQFHMHNRLIEVIQESLLNTSLTVSTPPGQQNYHCHGNGTCEAFVAAAGLNYGCTTTSETLDLLDAQSIDSTLFNISFAISYDFEQPILLSKSQYISDVDGSCTATLTTDLCNIVPATVWYPITIRNTTITVDYQALLNDTAVVRNYTSSADFRTDNITAPMGPLRGIWAGLSSVFSTEAILTEVTTGGVGYISNPDTWALVYDDSTLSAPESPAPQFVKDVCPFRWRSPTRDLLMYAFDFSFRAALGIAGQDDKYKQSYSAVYKGEELWHFTDFRFLGAAVAVMVLGIVAVSSLLWGWWQLDRYVTLSPLETGKAFGAPILMTAGPEQEADSIIREIGHERVAHGGDELVWNGTVYATGASQVSSLRSRTNRSTAYGEDTTLITAGSLSPGRSVRSHRRGISSVSSVGLSPSTPSFEHSLGVSTRRWDEVEEDEGDISYRPRTRSRSRSAGNGDDRIPLVPISLTPGQQGSPQLPPIPHTGPLRVEPLHSARSARRGSASHIVPGKRPLSAIEEKNSP